MNRAFPGGSGVKNPPGRDPWSRRVPRAAEQLSPCATITAAHMPRARTPQQENPPQWEACSPQLEKNPENNKNPCVPSSFHRVWLFVTPWTTACQAPLSMGFSREEYWSGCHFLLQGIFPAQESNLRLLCLLHWRRSLYCCATWEAWPLLGDHSYDHHNNVTKFLGMMEIVS